MPATIILAGFSGKHGFFLAANALGEPLGDGFDQRQKPRFSIAKQ